MVWSRFSLNEQLTICVLGRQPVVLCELIAEEIAFRFFPSLSLIVEDLDLVVCRRHFQSLNSLCHSRWIVRSHSDPALLSFVHWAISVGSIHHRAHLPLVGINAFITGKACDDLLVLLIAGVHCGASFLRIVVGNVLLCSASHSVVVLVYSHGIEHGISRAQNVFDFAFFSLLVNHLVGEDFVRGVKICLSEPDLTLGVSPRGEVACPILVGVVGIREHVVVFGRIGEVLLLESVNVHVWG